MYNPGGEYLSYIKDSTIRKPRSKIVVDGKTYTGLEHLVSFPKITHETEKMIGGFPAKTCEFEIYNLDGSLDTNGKEVQVYRGLDISDTKTVWVPMGLFYADGDDVTNNSTKRTIQFKGTDRTRLFDSPFSKVYGNGIIPADTLVSTVVERICLKHGLSVDSATKVNIISYRFTEAVGTPENTTDRQMISWVAELSGCIPIISRDGQSLVFTRPTYKGTVTEAGKTYQSGAYADKRKYKTLSAEPLYGPINAVSFGHADYDDAYVCQDDTDVQANGLHEWQINDNPLVENNREAIAPKVFAIIKGMELYPFSLTDFIDDYLFDINDGILIKRKDGTLITSYVLGMSTTSRIRSTFKAGTQDSSVADRKLAGSVKEEISRVKLFVDHVNNEITALAKESDDKFTEVKVTLEGLDVAINDEENGLKAQMTATAEKAESAYSMASTVINAGYTTTDDVNTLISQSANDITLSVERNLKIGARNILLDSACFGSFKPTARTATLQVGGAIDPGVPSGKFKRIVFNPTATATAGFKFAAADIIGNAVGDIQRVKPNTKYALSWQMRYNDTGCVPGAISQSNILLVDSNNQGLTVAYDASRTLLPQVTTLWQKYIAVFTTPNIVSDFEMRFLFKNSAHDDNDVGYIIDISSLKLEEGNIATDWTPSAEDVDQSVKAQISMCVTKDENNNLTSEINIASNLLTIDTANFTLAKDGTLTCQGATITGGTLISSDGKNESSKLTITAGTIRRYFDNELLCYYHASVPKSQNRYECLEYTNGLEIVKKQNTPTDIYYSTIFDDDGFSVRSNHRSSTPMEVSISSTTDWSYGSISAALRSIIEAKSALIISANRGGNALCLEGSSIVMCGQLTLPSAIGVDSNKSYVYVVADKTTGEINYLSA